MAVAVEISHGEVVGDVWSEVGKLRRAPVPLRGGHGVGDVAHVAVGHGDDVSRAVVVKVCNVQPTKHGAHLDDGGVRWQGGGETVDGLRAATVLQNRHVVAVAGVGGCPGGVVNALAAYQENVVVNAGAQSGLFGFTVIANFELAVAVGARRPKFGLFTAISCAGRAAGHGLGTGHRPLVDLEVLGRDVRVEAEDGHVVGAVVVEVTDLDVPGVEVGVTLAHREAAGTVVLNDGEVAGLAGRIARIVLLERVVALIDGNIKIRIAVEFADLDELDVGELVPVGVAAGVTGDPHVCAVPEIAVSVVPQDGDGVGAVGGNGEVVVPVAVKVTDRDVLRIASGGVGSCHRCTCRRSEGSHQRSREQRDEHQAQGALSAVGLGHHQHHSFHGASVQP